jgi:hypothetical protein
MFFTYLRRELFNRKRQTIIVSFGLAIAIAVVLVVNSLSNGASNAQSQVLGSLYGIGTDLTVTQAAAPPTPGQDNGRQRFDVPGGGTNADGSRQIARTNLRVSRGSGTLDANAVQTITNTPDVAAVATALSLTNTSFTGQLPQINPGQEVPGGGAAGGGGGGGRFGGGQGAQGGGTQSTTAPTLGDSNFSVDSFTVMGIGPDQSTGPLDGTTINSGRALTAEDAGQFNAMVDATYASSASLSLGSTITLGKSDGTTQDVTVVGIISSGTSAAETAANVYIPLDVAQSLSGNPDVVTNVYVAASSGSSTSSVADALKAALPNATVSTASDLGSTVSGSLSNASDLLNNLGFWLSMLVLALAFLMAVLFTMSGVGRRTREFGTLRALGWRKNRIVRQVAAESFVQGLLAGGIGLAIGFIAVRIVDAIAPTLQATTGGLSSGFAGGFRGGQGGGSGGGPGGGGGFNGPPGRGGFAGGQGGPRFGGRTGTTFDVVLKASLTPGIIALAIGLAIAGGLIAGAFGGFRASRLRPADALRSVA